MKNALDRLALVGSNLITALFLESATAQQSGPLRERTPETQSAMSLQSALAKLRGGNARFAQ